VALADGILGRPRQRQGLFVGGQGAVPLAQVLAGYAHVDEDRGLAGEVAELLAERKRAREIIEPPARLVQMVVDDAEVVEADRFQALEPERGQERPRPLVVVERPAQVPRAPLDHAQLDEGLRGPPRVLDGLAQRERLLEHRARLGRLSSVRLEDAGLGEDLGLVPRLAEAAPLLAGLTVPL
jgi:hypothetical protein